jgi:hypothetical protein
LLPKASSEPFSNHPIIPCSWSWLNSRGKLPHRQMSTSILSPSFFSEDQKVSASILFQTCYFGISYKLASLGSLLKIQVWDLLKTC